MLGKKKVSGTAAKLGRDAAYHHCTLLLSVDTSNLHSALNKLRGFAHCTFRVYKIMFHTPCVTEKFVSAAASLIESNATPSVRCPVDNLVSDIEVVLGV